MGKVFEGNFQQTKQNMLPVIPALYELEGKTNHIQCIIQAD